VLVVGEVALPLVLVCGAALLFRSLANLQRSETGVRLEHVLTMSIGLPESACPDAEDTAGFYTSLIERVGAAPGVTRAGLATNLPLLWIGNWRGAVPAGSRGTRHPRARRAEHHP
jgi:putative ABC transport system permease protein